ncbi:MAG TPA: DUF6597 domain-containing transcriptional factor [Puia sp.]|nr:DUF6597 domain-containing transcriptional factor [Puia sp.]
MTDLHGPYCYQRFAPGKGLAGFVKFFYCFRGRSSQPERILPLGSTEITFNLEAGGVKAYIVPPGCVPYFVVPEKMDRTVGICFSSWGLHGLLKVSPGEIGKEKAPLGEVLPRLWQESSGHIGDGGSLPALLSGLEGWLAGKASTARNNLAEDAIAFIDRQRGQLQLPELYRRYALSDRRLQMIFRESIGMSPKRYCKLKRFHFAVTFSFFYNLFRSG